MASVGRDALTKCGEIIKHVHTYRARADGCGAGTGRVATMGSHRATTGMQRATTGPQCPTMGLQHATTVGTRRRIDSSRRRVRNARRRVREFKKNRATTGTQRLITGTGSGDDGSRIGQRRVRPHADAPWPQYIRGAD